MFFAVLVAVLWGGNFVAAKFGMEYFPPVLFTALRFIIVAVVMVAFVKRPTAKQLLNILPISLMFALHFALLFASLHGGLTIASSALTVQLGVPFACLLGAVFLGDRLGMWRISGVVIAFIGIAIIAEAPDVFASPMAFAFAVISALMWSISNILIKRLEGVEPMALLAWVSVFCGPILIPLSLGFEWGQWPSLSHLPMNAMLGMAYTSFISTIVAYGMWYFLLSIYSVSQVTPFSLLAPFFGISFGQLFFAETLTSHVLLGGAITLAGVAIIVFRRPRIAVYERAA